MATVLDAPSALSTYILNGWVLTNQPCPTKGCRIPLLRSPVGQDPVVHLCVSCDATSSITRQPPAAPDVPQSTSTSTSSASHITRASTPATEVSEAGDGFPPFVETEEMRRRREQTDRASAEIGRRLLQGWTMLGDECPRDGCYYVPLVRPPKTSGDPDPKKECVLCGNLYTTQKDWAGRESLVPVDSGPAQNPATSNVPAASSTARPSQEVPQNAVSKSGHSVHPERNLPPPASTQESIMGALNASSEALQLSLTILTTRLTSLSSNSTLADPASIATTADAISKVTQALSQVKQLQWSEIQARSMT